MLIHSRYGRPLCWSLLAFGLLANGACQAPPPPITAARSGALSLPLPPPPSASQAPVAPAATASAVASSAPEPAEPQRQDTTTSAESESSDSPAVSEQSSSRGFGLPPGSKAEYGIFSFPPPPKGPRRSIMRTGHPTTSGGMSPDVVARILRQNAGRWVTCYERELTAHPKLAGTVELKFGVDARGAVQAPRIGASTLASPRLHQCLLKDLPQLAFPPPSELPAEVTEQLDLKPRPPDAKKTPAPADK